jgi:hypothetical protein
MAEIENLKKGINVDVVAQALRDVKEYAARSSEVNVDTMQLKLMHLDEGSTILKRNCFPWFYSVSFAIKTTKI